MVYRRRRFARGRRYRRKGFSRRRRFYRRGRKTFRRAGRRARIYSFKRTSRVREAVYNYVTYNSKTFSLAETPQYTEFTSLFDQYKINLIKIVWHFNKNSAELNNVTAPPSSTNMNLLTGIPGIRWYYDRDDGTVPNLASMGQIQKLKSASLHRPVKAIFKPNVLNIVYEGAVSNGYSPRYNQWIDCSDDGVPYYGLKYELDGSGSGRTSDTVNDIVIGYLTWDITYYMSFRDVR